MSANRAIMLLMVMFMVACTNSGTSTTDLTNRQWRLIEIDGQPPLQSEHALTIVFDATGRMNGFSGCNSFSGDYRINGATITLSNVMTTLMACADDAVTAQEMMFHQALQAVRQYELNAGTLVLRDENGAVRLRFQAF